MKYNFTLIIPTHNRYRYLKRSIDYFKDLDAKVIYCDSSEDVYSDYLASNMEYIHLPGKQFSEKILIALEKIKTDFVALCADDDFIVIESLYKACNILEKQNSFKTVLGKNVSFHENFDGTFYITDNILPEDIDFSSYKNASVFFSNYQQILWGLYDKQVISKSFELINKAKYDNDNFIELKKK
jgi:glycosyltransferase domain-containing protein